MSGDERSEPGAMSVFGDQEVALVDLLDRLLAGGVVLAGDITISLAGVDLVRVSLRALITSIAPVAPPDATVPSRRVESLVEHDPRNDRPRGRSSVAPTQPSAGWRPALEAGDG